MRALEVAQGLGVLALLFFTPPAPAQTPAGGPFWVGPSREGEVTRVVTLAPSLTEAVRALGRVDTLVGVTRFDTLPEVARLPRVGGFVDPNVEAVVRLKPDLVLAQPGPGSRQAVETMAALGVPVLALPMHSLDEVVLALTALGQVFDRVDAAKALTARIAATRERVRAKAAALPPRNVLFVYGFAPLVVAGPGSFADELLRDVGARNAAAKAKTPYAVYSLEAALAARPDVVIDASASGGGERLRALPGLSQARWVKVQSQALMHPGPSLVEGLDELFGLVYPGQAR
jgi:iron complex transport system substrate-binding protein